MSARMQQLSADVVATALCRRVFESVPGASTCFRPAMARQAQFRKHLRAKFFRSSRGGCAGRKRANTAGDTRCCSHGSVSRVTARWLNASTQRGDYRMRRERGFALVTALVMVALMAVIAIGVFTAVSLERTTAGSYTARYQAELAAQNGLQAAMKTLAAAPFPSPVPANFNTTVTGNDAFLVVRADGQADANGNRASYYFLAQPSTGANPTITYYPLFSASTDPSDPNVIQTQTINLGAPAAPAVPTPAAPPNSNPSDPGAAWNAAGTQRLPSLYSWQQPTPAPSGPSVKWVEMRDPQDAPSPAPHGLPYTRYAYWVEDLDGYLDASQVNDPTAVNARGNGTGNGTSPGEIAMFSIFNPTQQTVNPAPTPVANLVSDRNLLLTVPTLWQVPEVTKDVAGPNLAVRLGQDNSPGEQNLVPLGYGYLTEGQVKTPLNPVSQLRQNGNQNAKFANVITNAMPNFTSRTVSGAQTPSVHTVNYLNNLAANLLDYASPNDAPTEFAPPGNPNAPPASRGIGAYPFVVSIYDLNNWVWLANPDNQDPNYKVGIEVRTYVQLWNPHNVPINGALTVSYQNSDKVNVNGTVRPLSPPPDATIVFTANPSNDRGTPVIVSPLFETGNLNQPFNYQIRAANGYQDPKGTMQPNEYRVVALPAPTPSCQVTGNPLYSASNLPPGLSLQASGRNGGLISGTPTCDPNATYAGGYQDYRVPISTRTSCGTASATLVIRIYGSPCPAPTPTPTP
jgi:Tfp pilus assembly protein PilX